MTTEYWIALVAAFMALMGTITQGILTYRAKKSGNNPHPCRDHANKIDKLDERLDSVEKEQVRQGQKMTDICRVLDRVENKLNGMK